MKALLLFGLLSATFAAPAFAVEHYARCQSCTGGPSTWGPAAVTLAQSVGAEEDAVLLICKQVTTTYSVLGLFVVVHDPVNSTADIEFTDGIGYDSGCSDFGV